MEEIKLEIKMDFAQMDELNDIEQQLIKRAIEATHNSYAN